MWKYVSRRIRDTFERANYFDAYGATRVTTTNNKGANEKQNAAPPCRWYAPTKCWGSFADDHNNTNSGKWNFEHLNGSWLGAITWSSALVVGWYAGQIIHLKHKCKERAPRKCSTIKNFSAFSRYIRHGRRQNYIEGPAHIKESVVSFVPQIRQVGNNHGTDDGTHSQHTTSSGSADSSSSDLGDVLNSIENKLGLAAIENGQHQDGLNLLRSAANRHHAPALFNLGLCHELGLGVKPDEKMAMEFYRAAAAQEHPGALFNLSVYYAQGRGGLIKNTDTATRLLRLAAIKGQEDAIKALDTAVEIKEKPIQESWNYTPFIQTDQKSNMFDNHNLLISKCEATVY